MKNTVLIVILYLLVISCKSKKQFIIKKTVYKLNETKKDKVIKNAKNYLGTNYKYGGTTKKGMDCSGLIYTVFKKEKIYLPRTSKAMSLKGKSITLQQVKKGDLLFFATSKKNKINHVGLVTKINNKDIFFIHASIKRGVIQSLLHEKYYKSHFIKAKRIL